MAVGQSPKGPEPDPRTAKACYPCNRLVVSGVAALAFAAIGANIANQRRLARCLAIG